MTKANKQDLYVGIVITVLALFFYLSSMNISKSAAAFPLILIVLIALFGLLIIINSLRNKSSDNNTDTEEISIEVIKSPIIVLLITGFYVLLITLFGYFIATAVFFTCYFFFMKITGVIKYIAIIVGFSVFIYLLFVFQLKVPMPEGLFFS